MKIFAFEELTYPGLPPNLGPEVRLTDSVAREPTLLLKHSF
jgi:hypothetical protein